MSKVEYILGIVIAHAMGIISVMLILWRFLRSPIKFTTSTFFTKHDVMPACLNDPSLGTHGYIQLEDVKLHYVSCGDEDKPLMLCLHGFPEFWYSWRYQIREFSKDFRVVAVDQRGFSESDKPAGVYSYTMELLVKDIKQLIPALGYSSCTLMAHDWGGAVAWEFVMIHADMVDKFMVFNCPPPIVFKKRFDRHRSQRKKSWYVLYFQVKLLPEFNYTVLDFSILRAVFKALKNTPFKSEDYDAYIYAFSIKGALTATINWYRAAFWRTCFETFKENPEKIKVSTLLVWGVPDRALDTEMAYMCEDMVENLTIKIVKDSNHYVMQDKPFECNRLVREFLQQNQ